MTNEINPKTGKPYSRQALWARKNPEKRKAISERSYAKNGEASKGANREWRRRNVCRVLLAQCKRGAKLKGLECTITLALLEERLSTGACSVTGLPYDLSETGAGRRRPWAPSVDRLDNSLGYTPSNTRLVCCAFNLMRSDFPDDVLRTLVEALAESWR